MKLFALNPETPKQFVGYLFVAVVGSTFLGFSIMVGLYYIAGIVR